MHYKKYLFLITLTYFILGIINIHFALLGLICMALPLILLFITNKKLWCQQYCPRSNLYTTMNQCTTKSTKMTPRFFIQGNMKWIMFAYFALSLTMIIVSTFQVANGKTPNTQLRFLMIFPLPNLFQLFQIETLPWITHFAYRFYSMMFTTTTLGLILALIYRPRTWCTICPIATVSTVYLNYRKDHPISKT